MQMLTQNTIHSFVSRWNSIQKIIQYQPFQDYEIQKIIYKPFFPENSIQKNYSKIQIWLYSIQQNIRSIRIPRYRPPLAVADLFCFPPSKYVC